MAEIPDDGNGGDVSVVAVENRRKVLGSLGVLHVGRRRGSVPVAAVAGPGAIDELVGAGRAGVRDSAA